VIALAVLPIVLSLVLWRCAPALAARCTPSWAARALVLLCLAAALTTGIVLCTVAWLAFAEIPAAGRFGHWSADALADQVPVPAVVGASAAAVAALSVIAAGVHLVRTLRRMAAAARACRALGSGVDGLIIVDDERAGAYALPGWPGRIVVSRALLRVLDADERRAVLAHEAAHLRHRHFVYVQLAQLAAVANPLLRPAAAQVCRAVELWADDDAATVVGDRLAVARALARAALAHPPVAAPEPALAVARSDLACRVRNLLEPPPRRTGRAVALMVAVTIACTGSGLAVSTYAHARLEHAESRYSIELR